MKTQNIKNIEQAICLMYNDFDISVLEKHAKDDLVYESQWVYTPINGKTEVMKYLTEKFEAIKGSNIKLLAMAAENTPADFSMILIKQADQTIGAVLKIENDKISRIDIVNPAFYINHE